MQNLMRSAEKDRKATCPFGNAIASIAIAEFRRLCPLEYKQTVLASIILQYPFKHARNTEDTNFFQVVAIGVGTKVVSSQKLYDHRYLGQNKILAELNNTNRIQVYCADSIVRDCHAEVLARRAFLKYLYHVLNTQHSSLVSSTAENEKCAFVLSQTTGLLQLKPGYSFHFYSSSQPCGNASIKRWVKSKKPVHHELPVHAYPVELHVHHELHVTARNEGQVALLVKTNGSVSSLHFEHTPGFESSKTNNMGIQYSDANIPAGVALVGSERGCVMSCSDKIAKWNALGWQGTLLSNAFEPILMQTITVGRKFCQLTCERALCCRLGSFIYTASIDSASGTKYVQFRRPESNFGAGNLTFRTFHPAMLGASVKFDTSCIVTAATPTPPNSAYTKAETSAHGENSAGSGATDKVSTGQTKFLHSHNTNKLRFVNETVGDKCSQRQSYGFAETDEAIETEPETYSKLGAQFTERRCLAWWCGIEDDLSRHLNILECGLSREKNECSEIFPLKGSVHVIDGSTGYGVVDDVTSSSDINMNDRCDPAPLSRIVAADEEADLRSYFVSPLSSTLLLEAHEMTMLTLQRAYLRECAASAGDDMDNSTVFPLFMTVPCRKSTEFKILKNSDNLNRSWRCSEEGLLEDSTSTYRDRKIIGSGAKMYAEAKQQLMGQSSSLFREWIRKNDFFKIN